MRHLVEPFVAVWCVVKTQMCESKRERQTDRQAGRQAGRQADRQTDRQTDTECGRNVVPVHVELSTVRIANNRNSHDKKLFVIYIYIFLKYNCMA